MLIVRMPPPSVSCGESRRTPSSVGPRSLRAERMVAARLQWMEERSILEAAERVTTGANLWADLGSRLRASEVERQAQLLGLRLRVVEAPPEWRGATWDDERTSPTRRLCSPERSHTPTPHRRAQEPF